MAQSRGRQVEGGNEPATGKRGVQAAGRAGKAAIPPPARQAAPPAPTAPGAAKGSPSAPAAQAKARFAPAHGGPTASAAPATEGRFVIVECTYTLELFYWCLDRGIEAWVPTIDGKAAVPGYAFIKESQYAGPAYPPKHFVRPLLYYDDGRPWCCTGAALADMRASLEGAQEKPARKHDLKPGMRVYVEHGLLEGMQGKIQRLRKNGTAHVLMGSKYISLPTELLVPV